MVPSKSMNTKHEERVFLLQSPWKSCCRNRLYRRLRRWAFGHQAEFHALSSKVLPIWTPACPTWTEIPRYMYERHVKILNLHYPSQSVCHENSPKLRWGQVYKRKNVSVLEWTLSIVANFSKEYSLPIHRCSNYLHVWHSNVICQVFNLSLNGKSPVMAGDET